MADIQIVQGDDKHILVNFVCPNKDEDCNELVESFYFTSKRLGIDKHITEKDNDGRWYIALSSEETINLPPIVSSFDITAKTIDSDTITGFYHGTICVKKKDNSIGL